MFLAQVEERLKQLNRRFRLGLFDGELFAEADRLRVLAQDADPTRTVVLLKCRCVTAEILDLQGLLKKAQKAVQEGAAVREHVRPNKDDRLLHDPMLARECVRFVADFARFHHYREARFALAEEILRECLAYIEKLKEASGLSLHGTHGMTLYYTGCAVRQLGRLHEADRLYRLAIEEYRKRADLASRSEDAERREEGLALSRHALAVILGLGIGWTSSQAGRLEQALNGYVAPAQLLLMGSQDRVHGAYLELIRGSIDRSLAGSSNPEQLAEAAKSVERAYQVFKSAPFRREAYACRAAYEMSLCKLAASDFVEAEKWIKKAKNHAHDKRWEANVWIVRSRICRRSSLDRDLLAQTDAQKKAADDALEAAQTALRLMEGQEEQLGSIDALIARAEALMSLGRTAESRKDLLDALKLARRREETTRQMESNPKIESVVHIHLARSYIIDGDIVSAERHMREWGRLESRVEHSWVRELATSNQEQLARLRLDFRIAWDASDDLNYKRHNLELRRWLVRRAWSLDGNKTRRDVAASLGITRTALNYWEREPGFLEGKDKRDVRDPSVAAQSRS